jgi:predicted secreted Zn-dependent protease
MADDPLDKLDPVVREALGVMAAAIVRLEEKQEKQATEHQRMMELVDKAVTQTEKCCEMTKQFVSRTTPAVKDMAMRLAALTLEVERAERPPRPPGDSSVN